MKAQIQQKKKEIFSNEDQLQSIFRYVNPYDLIVLQRTNRTFQKVIMCTALPELGRELCGEKQSSKAVIDFLKAKAIDVTHFRMNIMSLNKKKIASIHFKHSKAYVAKEIDVTLVSKKKMDCRIAVMRQGYTQERFRILPATVEMKQHGHAEFQVRFPDRKFVIKVNAKEVSIQPAHVHARHGGAASLNLFGNDNSMQVPKRAALPQNTMVFQLFNSMEIVFALAGHPDKADQLHPVNSSFWDF